MRHEGSASFRLRRATANDAAAIGRLRSSPEVRAVSRRRHALDPADFEREIVASIESPDAEVLVVEVEGTTAGYVRLEPRQPEEFEIGIALGGRWRGRGLGPQVIAEATRDFLANRPNAAIFALTRPENVASSRAFEAAGYKPAGESGEFLVHRAGAAVVTRRERVVSVVQARSGSKRFPGKVLADVEGLPLLARVLQRLLRSRESDRFAVATSTAPGDDAIAAIAEQAGVEVVRGPLDDVLERYRLAAAALDADAIVRVTGDCPLLDASVVDRVVGLFCESGADYASNVHPPTFPDGLDVEVLSRSALEQVARAARERTDREHVTLYVARHPERFTHASLVSEVDRSAMRWTVDYPDDLEFVRAVFRRFQGHEDAFGTDDILRALEDDEELRRLMPTHARNQGLERSLAAETDGA